jgi:Ras-related protein Rab-1A
LLIRFVDDQFKGDLLATIGVDFRFRTLDVDGRKVKLQIWDTAGQDTFRTIISAYYKGADSIVILFDLNEPITFKDIKDSWKSEIN